MSDAERLLVRGAPAGSFVVREHAAASRHFDFRLEVGGTMRSWAVPSGPSIERGHAVLLPRGEKPRGGFALQRTGDGESPRWLLVKRRDEEAPPGSDVVAEHPRSPLGGRTLDELLAERGIG